MLKIHPSDQPSLGLSHSGSLRRPFHTTCISQDFKSVTPFSFLLDVQQVVNTSESEPSPSQSRKGSLHPPFFLLLESSFALQVSVVSGVILLLFFHRNCIGMICFTARPNFKPQMPAGSIPWMQFP